MSTSTKATRHRGRLSPLMAWGYLSHKRWSEQACGVRAEACEYTSPFHLHRVGLCRQTAPPGTKMGVMEVQDRGQNEHAEGVRST